MTRTISIIGTDWSGPDPTWIRQPFLDGGRLHFDRMQLADWKNVFYELGFLARVDGLAVGIRGAWDEGAVASLPIARAAYHGSEPKPTLMPFYDTGGLPDVVPDYPFDFENPQHIMWGWERYARIFFDHFKDLPLERSPNGKVLMLWWSNDTWIGHGFKNQRSGQRLLDAVDRQVAAIGLGGADHIVDRSWVRHAPQIRVFGVHEWFNPWQVVPSARSISTHNGVTVGLTVPSFYHKIEPQGGAVLRASLEAFRDAKADYVFMESGTNFVEAAELMRDSTGDTSKLDVVREHMRIVKGEADMPAPVPIAKATFAISRRESFAHPSKAGYFVTWHPKNQRDTVLSVQGNGDIVTRLLNAPPVPAGGTFDPTVHGLGGVPGGWESWKAEGNRAVFDETPEYFAIPLVD